MKKKFLVFFILFSLAVHAFVIALSLHIAAPPQETDIETMLKVELKTAKEIDDIHNTRGKRQVLTPPPKQAAKGFDEPLGEASVGLENPGGAYESYLVAIRRRIERLWSYPPAALAENREGSAVIRFTISADGVLVGSSVVSSSGSALLDEGALACIRAAAPFAPLPALFNLSLLNVTATFSYRINI